MEKFKPRVFVVAVNDGGDDFRRSIRGVFCSYESAKSFYKTLKSVERSAFIFCFVLDDLISKMVE